MADILINMFENSIAVSVIILILFLLRPFLSKRYTAKWQYGVWLVVTVRLLVPFDIEIPNFTAPLNIPVENKVVYQADVAGETADDIITTPSAGEQSDNMPENTVTDNSLKEKVFDSAASAMGKNSLAVADILAVLWVCGALLIISVRAGSYIIARYTLNESLIPFDIDISESKRKLGLEDEIPVYYSDMVSTPVLSGVIRPIVVVPDNAENDMHLQVAIYHELVHYKRYDVFFKFMLFAVTSIYWFNPVIWLMNTAALEDIELSCDESIYKKMNSEGKNLYGKSILHFAASRKSRLLFATSFNDSKKTIATRIKHIFDENRKKRGALALAAVVTVTMLGGLMVGFGGKQTEAAPTYKTDEVPAQAQNFIDVYCRAIRSDDYWTQDNNHIGFVYMLYNEIIPQKYYHYDRFGNYTYMLDKGVQNEIFRFMMADEMPYEWHNAPEANNFVHDYLIPDVQLQAKGITWDGDSRFTVVYSRWEDNIPAYDISFTMEKQTVYDVPSDLAAVFSEGQEVWRIKHVLEIPVQYNQIKKEIEINSLEEFLQFADDVKNNSYNLQGNVYRLNTDIDLSGVEFTPMFNKRDYELRQTSTNTDAKMGFNATFDGQGHTISNLEIIYDCGTIDINDQIWAKVGLFGHIGSEGCVKNLNVVNAKIDFVTPDYARYPYSSGIIAGSSSGQILNCSVQGTVNGASQVGGVVGALDENGILRSCMADVTVKGYNEVGCLAGSIAFGGVYNCTTTGVAVGVQNDYMDDKVFKDMVTPYAIGGFAGRIHFANITYSHSDSQLQIMSTGKTIGAFAASCQSSAITGCTYNSAKAGSWKKIGYYHSGYDDSVVYAYELDPK